MSANLDFSKYENLEQTFTFKNITYTMRLLPSGAGIVLRDKLLSYGMSEKQNKEIKIQWHKDHSDALTQCVFDEDNNLVKPIVVKEWPTPMVEELIEKMRKINKLDNEEEEDSVKN